MIDNTFAPGSQVLAKLQRLAPELPALVFTSLPKSVSRGLTTGGAITANHAPDAAALLEDIHLVSVLLDTTGTVQAVRQLRAGQRVRHLHHGG